MYFNAGPNASCDQVLLLCLEDFLFSAVYRPEDIMAGCYANMSRTCGCCW